MVLTLTLWQKRRIGMPTCAGEGKLIDPSQSSLDAALRTLLAMVENGAEPFQIVVRAGDTSRGFQFENGWHEDHVRSELWSCYVSIPRTTN